MMTKMFKAGATSGRCRSQNFALHKEVDIDSLLDRGRDTYLGTMHNT